MRAIYDIHLNGKIRYYYCFRREARDLRCTAADAHDALLAFLMTMQADELEALLDDARVARLA